MKKYEATLIGHYEKTISVYADSPEDARRKMEIVLFDTDLIDFSDEDFVSGEANIAEADKDGCEETEAEDGIELDECCPACPYLCPVCGECMCEDGDKDMSYQALNLVIHLAMETQFAC